MHMRNMEMSFFVVCPLRNCECKAPKSGMNCNQSLTILFPFDSSRFSGHISRIYKGIPKKRHLHAHSTVSFMNNPESSHLGQILKLIFPSALRWDRLNTQEFRLFLLILMSRSISHVISGYHQSRREPTHYHPLQHL